MGETPSDFAALFLVGGRARRLAGAAKSELVVGEATILERMLAACEEAAPRVVVGARPESAVPLPEGVVAVVEDPPGSGPARAIAAGIGQVPASCGWVAIFPGDLPFLTPDAVLYLRKSAAEAGTGAVFCDHAGRRQWLCGVWPADLVRAGAAAVRAGDPVRSILGDVPTQGLGWLGEGPPPWFDCDTPDDLEQARSWAEAL
jgi:molybdenum cofactor guanylyltransferase